jgi:hypothetical protein
VGIYRREGAYERRHTHQQTGSPDKIVGHYEVLIRIVRLRARSCTGGWRSLMHHDRVLVALAYTGDGGLRYHRIVALVAHDRDRSLYELLTQSRRNREPREPVPIGEIKEFLAHDRWQPVLLDELFDFRAPRLRSSLFLLLAIQLLVARIFGRLRLEGSQLFRGDGRGLVPRRRLLRRRGRLFRLFLGAETRLDQLVAQRHAHDSISLAEIPDAPSLPKRACGFHV